MTSIKISIWVYKKKNFQIGSDYADPNKPPTEILDCKPVLESEFTDNFPIVIVASMED